MDNEQASALEPTWAVIELFGHAQIAGKLSTVTLGGSVLLKVEVPETITETIKHGYFHWDFENLRYAPKTKIETRTPAYTRMFGLGAIYALNPCTEAVARTMARRIQPGETARQTQIEVRTALPPPDPIEVDGKLLSDGTPEEDMQLASEEGPAPTCPQCGSEHVDVEESSEIIGILVICNDCGKTTHIKDPDRVPNSKEGANEAKTTEQPDSAAHS